VLAVVLAVVALLGATLSRPADLVSPPPAG
jgi:hypothetical protein